jgi:biotin synthase
MTAFPEIDMNAVVSSPIVAASDGLRHDWRLAEVEALFELPFMDLLFRAQQIHRAHHAPNRVQMSTLLSIKTGGCPEDCGYCPQSAHHDGPARKSQGMLSVHDVRLAAQRGAGPELLRLRERLLAELEREPGGDPHV